MDIKAICDQYAARESELTPIEALTMLTEAYMEQCGISMTYRTLVEGASWYWQELLATTDHELAKIAKKKSFTGLMPYLSEEFNERKEHYWDYDICNLDSGDAVDAAKSFLEDYEDGRFRIAFCRGIIYCIEQLKEYEVERDRILAENPHLTVFRGLNLDQLSTEDIKALLGSIENAIKSMVGDKEPTHEYIEALDDIEKKQLKKLLLQQSVLLNNLEQRTNA